MKLPFLSLARSVSHSDGGPAVVVVGRGSSPPSSRRTVTISLNLGVALPFSFELDGIGPMAAVEARRNGTNTAATALSFLSPL